MRVGELKGYTDDELRIASEFDESGPEGVRIWRRLWECVNARNVEMGTEEDQLLLKQWRDALKALRRLEHEAARDPVTGEVTSIARMLLRPEGRVARRAGGRLRLRQAAVEARLAPDGGGARG